jgi:GH24 family phage-related lysozyme (muramidase)
MDRKPIFDAVRAMLNRRDDRDRGFAPYEVQALDRAIDTAMGVERPAPDWVVLAAPLIHEFEGYAVELPNGNCKAYPDPATGGEPWTIGFGSTTDEKGEPIEPGTIWTRERAEERFARDLRKFGEGVAEAIDGAPTTPAQMAALVSLAYNIGLGAFGRSTALKRHKAGDHEGAAEAITWFNKAAGRVMRGLVRRRAAEKELYLS